MVEITEEMGLQAAEAIMRARAKRIGISDEACTAAIQAYGLDQEDFDCARAALAAAAPLIEAAVRERIADHVDEFSWTLMLFEDVKLNGIVDDVACAVQEQIAAAIREGQR